MDYDYIILTRKTFQVFWLKKADEARSYRFRKEDANMNIERLKDQGWDIIPDPFRKGAPLGGYRHEL